MSGSRVHAKSSYGKRRMPGSLIQGVLWLLAWNVGSRQPQDKLQTKGGGGIEMPIPLCLGLGVVFSLCCVTLRLYLK